MINFIQDCSSAYPPRTRKNAAGADATIAFALDFSTPGEILTKRCVNDAGKIYLQVPIDENGLDIKPWYLNTLIKEIEKAKVKSINIAGNGIDRLAHLYNQKQVDGFTYECLNYIFLNTLNDITMLRSGGQSGFDEAGIKAAMCMHVPEIICLAPAGWKYRDETGKDICDEQKFKARFLI